MRTDGADLRAGGSEQFGSLKLSPASQRPDLMAAAVSAALAGGAVSPESVRLAQVDPALSDTAAFCAAYGVPAERSANCVIVSGRRDGVSKWAAVVVLASTRADVNGVVRRLLDVRKVSFAGQDEAVELTGMEYGGITPIGLPDEWPVFLDEAVAAGGPVIIGSGIRASKILVDGALLGRLPNAQVVAGLARPVAQVPS